MYFYVSVLYLYTVSVNQAFCSMLVAATGSLLLILFKIKVSMPLHYVVKLENYNCCRFQWHIACETSEFILQDIRPP